MSVRIQVLDIIGVTASAQNEDLVSRVISSLASEIGMKRVGGVVVSRQRKGCTYMQLLRESHITAYTQPSGEVIISIVSCRYFDEAKALDYVGSELELSNVTINGYRR